MTLLTPQAANYPSLSAVYTAVNASDTAAPGDDIYLHVKNANASPTNVTVSSFPNTNDWGASIADLVVAVPNAQERFIGPLRGSNHMDPATGLVTITYSVTASVTAALIKI